MLKTVETSRAQKTKGLAVTYRAGSQEKFGTCPASCELNPSGCGASKIDQEYLNALSLAVPTKGVAFTYSHFSPIHWIKKNGPGKTVINYSAKTATLAAKYIKMAVPTVATVALDFWNGRKSVDSDGARFVRCPAEYLPKFGCAQCGNGDPLCARLERDYVIGFTAHGVHKKKAANPDDPGGCYASGGNVLLHWEATADQAQDESDADKVTRFAKSLAPRTILRHHIAGDIGDD
jgi:hypothetical protein